MKMKLTCNSIDLDLDGEVASVRFPASAYPPGLLLECVERAHRVSSWDLGGNDDRQVLQLQARPGCLEEAIREVFAQLHGYPFFSRDETDSFKSSTTPLISCIILLTANDLFVANHLLPSIISHSKGFDIEILIVYNGLDADLSLFHQFDFAFSEFGCVSKGYNEGIARSRGQYVAIFHDDCIIADANWIPKCLALLEAGYWAVSPEIQQSQQLGAGEPLPVLKNVPLVMLREGLLSLNCYDETYYIGYEDFDLTHQILSRGGCFSEVQLDYVHCKGMSTVLMFGGQRALYKRCFALDLVPVSVVTKLQNTCLQALMGNEKCAWIQRNEFCYFLSKFDWHWAARGYVTALALSDYLVKEIGSTGALSLIADRKSMIDSVQRFAAQ